MQPTEEKLTDVKQLASDMDVANEILQVIQKAMTDHPDSQNGGKWESNHLMLAALMFTAGTAVAVDLPQQKLVSSLLKLHNVMTSTMNLPDDLLATFQAAADKATAAVEKDKTGEL